MEMIQFPLHRTADGGSADGRSADAEGSVHDLEALHHRVAELWTVEPRGGAAIRGRLHLELHRLELEIERLSLLAAAGEYVPQAALVGCASRYFTLRRRWSGDDLAA